MAKFKSWTQSTELFELKSGVISSKGAKPLDIRNYMRADRYYTRSDLRLKHFKPLLFIFLKRGKCIRLT